MEFWITLNDVIRDFERIKPNIGKKHCFVFEFKPLVERNLQGNKALQHEFMETGGLFHWDQKLQRLTQEWTLADLENSIQILQNYLSTPQTQTREVINKFKTPPLPKRASPIWPPSKNNAEQPNNIPRVQAAPETEHQDLLLKISEKPDNFQAINLPEPKPRTDIQLVQRYLNHSNLHTDYRYAEIAPNISKIRAKYQDDHDHPTLLVVKTPRPLPRKNIIKEPMQSSHVPFDFTTQQFYQMEELIEKPFYKFEEIAVYEKILPYVLQQLKFLDGRILENEKLRELIDYGSKRNRISSTDYGIYNFAPNRPMTPQQSVEESGQPLLTTAQIWSLIVKKCELSLIRILLKLASKYERSIPIYAGGVSLLSLFDQCFVQWANPAENAVINTPYLGGNYKVLTFLQLGESTVGIEDLFGKVDFLNKLFKQQVFSHNEEGEEAYGEINFITKDRVQPIVWSQLQDFHYKNNRGVKRNELIFLINCNGEFINFKQTLRELANQGGSFMCFLTQGCTTSMLEKFKEIVNYNPEQNHNIGLLTLNPELDFPSENPFFIRHSITAEESVKCIIGALGTLKSETNQTHINTSFVYHSDVQSLCKKLFANNSEPKSIFVLQKIKKFNFKKFSTLWNEQNNEGCREIMDAFAKILNLPLLERIKAVTHLESEIGKRNLNISNQVELKIIKSEDNEKCSFGIEHLFRELGQAYQMIKFEAKNTQQMDENSFNFPVQLHTNLAENVADLIINGMTVEILDGDLGRISRFWFEEVCDAVSVRCPNLRVYVISILGLQSTGKSTILNSIFGCDFAVSVGKCTKGLFMKLIFLSEKSKAKLGIDAIIVLDTEGLGSDDDISSECSIKDRRMATLAMSISNLTLINTFGESQNFIINILQIVIITMARLEKADQVPDILLIRHVPYDSRILDRGIGQCINALKCAIDIVETHGEEIGVKQCKSLINLEKRLKSGDNYITIRPYKGTGIGDPPSYEYHEDILTLYKRIQTGILSIPTNNILFSSWYQFIDSYWEAIQEQNFITQFQSIKQIQDHFEVGSRIGQINEWIDAAFTHHVSTIEDYIKHQIFRIQYNTSTSETDTMIQNKVYEKIEKLDTIPYNCDRFIGNSQRLNAACDECQAVVRLIEDLIEFQKHKISSMKNEHLDGIQSNIKQSKDYHKIQLFKLFDNSIEVIGKADKFQDYITKVMSDVQGESEATPEKIWKLVCNLAKNDYPPEDISEKIITDLISVYDKMGINKEEWKKSFLDLKVDSVITPAFHHAPAKREDILLTLVKSFRVDSKDKKKSSRKLEKPQLEWLEAEIDLVPGKIIVEAKAGRYEPTMSSRLKEKVKDLLDRLERKFHFKVLMRFREDVHFYAAKKFFISMFNYDRKRRNNIEPYYIFRQRKDIYITKISSMLNYETTMKEMEVTGSRIAQLIFQAVIASVIEKGKKSRLTYILKLPWINSPEKIRLMYIQHLVKEIKLGNKKNVARSFLDFKESLKVWYYTTLESNFEDEYKKLSIQLFNDEIDFITEDIKKTQTISELQNLVGFYLDQQQINLLFLQLVQDDVKMFMRLQGEIGNALQFNREKWIQEIKLPDIRDEKLLDLALGCMATCPWCGGICWCQKGHEMYAMTLSKHFTCHQPHGFVGTFDSETGELIPGLCDSTYGINKVENLHGDEVEDDFLWLYDRHPRSDYCLLLKWIFMELNTELAEVFNCLPVSEITFEGYGYDRQLLMENFDSIVSYMGRQEFI